MPKSGDGIRRSRAVQWLALGVAGAAGAVMTSQGVLASWAATAQSATGADQAAVVSMTHTDTNGTTFSSGVSNLLPGDYVHRYARLVNTGTLAQDFTATVAGTGTGLAAAGGLQIAVDSCSVAWAGDGSCGGTLLPVVTTRDVATAGTVPLGQIAPGGAANLRYKFVLNALADQLTFQGKTGGATVTVNGTLPVAGGRDRTNG